MIFSGNLDLNAGQVCVYTYSKTVKKLINKIKCNTEQLMKEMHFLSSLKQFTQLPLQYLLQ